MTTSKGRGFFDVRKIAGRAGWVGILLITLMALSCSGDSPTESVGELRQALTSNESILGFEGPVGGSSPDWSAGSGTTANSSTAAFSGAHALSLSGSANASAVSAKLTTLGPISSTAKIQVSLPSSLQGQGWLGQIALFFNAPSAGVYNQYAGPTAFSGQVGQYKQYAITIPSSVVTALSTKSYSDLTITVQLNVPSTSGAFLIDELVLTPVSDAGADASVDADASSGSGSTGAGGSTGSGGSTGVGGTTGGGGSGVAGAQGAGGTGGTVGSGGTTGTGGGITGGGTGGAGGSSGAGGSGGSTGAGGGAAYDFFFKLPVGVHREDVVFATTGGDLFVDDGVKLLESSGFASVSGVDGGTVNRVGVASEVQNIWSAGNVTLANRAVVHGILQTTGTISQQQDSVVSGTVIAPAILDPLQTVDWTVVFPSTTLGSASLEPDQVRTIAPGSYADASIKSRAHLKFSPGVYTFESLSAEPDAVFEIDNTGPVLIYSRSGFTFRGQIQRTQSVSNILFGTASTGAVAIESPFIGILVAPWAAVSLATASAGHSVSVFAKSITTHQNTNITHLAFNQSTFCVLGSSAPGCPTHCTNHIQDANETEVDCGGECPGCNPGHVCNQDSDCSPGLICGNANGACFGLARAIRLCWKRECESDVQSGGCGTPTSACGSNCACVTKCDASDPTSTCPSGEVCKQHLGGLVDAPFPDACFDSRCPSNDPALCGSIRALCGSRCVCTPDCSHATCADPSDGCGGTCPGACKDGETGCTDDVNCPAGHTCVQSDDGVRTCLSTKDCVYKAIAPPLCGTPNALCGARCPACSPQCNGRTCGPDPNCGQSCGSCSTGSFCSLDGQCIAPFARQGIMVPDGNGGQRPLEHLPAAVTSPVGALKGGFSVSEQGTAQYTIPIEVPPGRAGMEPVLSLQYSGTRVNEELGVGWHLEGLSQITRCPRAQALDKFSSPIQNDKSDHFCIDGKRLENVKGVTTGTVGEYGANGTEYRTMIDSFSRVVSYQDSGSGIQLDPSVAVTPVRRDLQGPDYFRVWTKDGRILTFGRTRESLVVAKNGIRYAWLLNRVEDHFGNTMDVGYTNSPVPLPSALADRFPNVLRPRLISYTGHTDGSSADESGKRQVQFSYENRNDQQLRIRQGGVAYFAQQRLSRITTLVNGVAVKNYRLAYRQDVPFSQVDHVSECPGDSDALCKPPTRFEYKEESGFELGGQQLDFDFTAAAQLDVNGDGIPDYLTTTVTSTQPGVSDTLKGVEFGTDTAIDVGGLFLGGVGGAVIDSFWGVVKDGFWGLFEDSPTFSVARTMQIGQGDRARVWNSVSNVTGVPCGPDSPAYVLDYDRDGQDDLVAACGINNGDLFVARSLGTGNFAAYPSAAPVVRLSMDQIRVPDNYYSNVRDYDRQEPPASPILFDINGDSLQDIVSCKDQFTLEVRLRLGPGKQGFGPAIQLAKPRVFEPGQAQNEKNQILCGQGKPTYHTFDIDGDGTPKLLVHADTGWQVLRYSTTDTGPGKIEFRPVQLTPVQGSADGGGFPALGDLNGDGLLDVWSGARDNSGTAIVWLNTGDGRFSVHHLTRPLPALQQSEPFAYAGTAVADFNADGRADLIETWAHRSPDVGFGQQVEFFNTALVPDSPVTALQSQPPSLIWSITTEELGKHDVPGSFRASGDIDGDGITDLFGYGIGTFFGKGAHNMLLSHVVDGVGNEITVEYDAHDSFNQTYSTDANCAGTTWPEKCLKRMSGLVASHSEGFVDASGHDVAERSYSYHYINARMNLTGHGWLGFDLRTMTRAQSASNAGNSITAQYEPVARYDLNGNVASDLTKPYLYPLAGLPKVVTIDDFADERGSTPPLQTGFTDRRTQIVNTWSVKQSAFNRPFPFVTSRVTNTYDKQPSPVVIPSSPTPPPLGDNGILLTDCSEALTPDAYGNVAGDTETCHLEGFDADKTSTTKTFEQDTANWLITNPITISVTSTRDTSQTEQSVLSYENGMLATDTRATTGTSDQRRKTTYQRDRFGNIRQIIKEVLSGEPNRTASITYDPDNVFPATITNALGQMSEMDFDDHWGAPQTIKDPNGIWVQRSYDGFGRLAETKGPRGTAIATYAGSSVQNVDTAVGLILPRIDVTIERRGTDGTRDGLVTSAFDNYGRLVQSRTEGFAGTDVFEERAYDELGRLHGTTRPHTGDAIGPTDLYTYDHLHRVTQVDHSDGSSKKFQYASPNYLANPFRQWLDDGGCDGLVCALEVMLSIDEEGKKNVVLTDHRGLVARSIDGDNVDTTQHSSNYEYGPFSRLVQAKDNLGNTTAFAYDPYGRRTGLTDPDTGSSLFTYNGYDELKTSIDPKHQTRTYSYDDIGRLTNIVDADATARWFYDQGVNGIGRLAESISPSTTENPDGQHIHYTYESPTSAVNRGLVKTVEYTLDGRTHAVNFDYDGLGRTQKIHYPSAANGAPVVAQYGYDSSGILTDISEVGGSASKPIWHLDETFQAHLIQMETFGNGASTTYGYNADRRWLESLKTSFAPVVSQNIQSLDYTHFANGQIKTKVTDDLRGSTPTREFQYDNLNRLSYTLDTTPTQQQGIATPYSYNAIGNITGRGAIVSTYLGQPHLVEQVAQNSYEHDLNGNVSSREGPDVPAGFQLIDYTPFDLPSSITTGSGNTAKVSRFEYSADEERVVRRNSDSTLYSVGDFYQRLVSTSSGDTIEERFRIYSGSRQIAEIYRNPSTNETRYFHADAIGTIDTISTDSPSFSHQDFDPFGAPTDPLSVPLTRVGFTGHEHDQDLGLIDMKGRIYDPLAARFTSADPVMQAPYSSQGLNRYSYAFNNPVNNIDPTGFDASWYYGESSFARDTIRVNSSGGYVTFGSAVPGGSQGAGITGTGVGATLVGLGLDIGIQALTGTGLFAPSGPTVTTHTAPAPSAAPAASGAGQASMNNATGQDQGGAGPQSGVTDSSHNDQVAQRIAYYREQGGTPFDAWDRAREDYRQINLTGGDPVLRDAEHYLLRYALGSNGTQFVRIPKGLPIKGSPNPTIWLNSTVVEDFHDPLYDAVRPVLDKVLNITPTTPEMKEWEQRGFREGYCASGDCGTGKRIQEILFGSDPTDVGPSEYWESR